MGVETIRTIRIVGLDPGISSLTDSPGVEEDDMPKSWTDKRERQYEHIKDSYEERGRSEDKAEELAARTVNKERAEQGETKDSKKS